MKHGRETSLTAGGRAAVRRWKTVSGLLVVALVVLGVADLRTLSQRVQNDEANLDKLEAAVADERAAAEVASDLLEEELRRAKDALEERRAGDWDIVERLGRAQERLGICEDSLVSCRDRADHAEHLWRRRRADYNACVCELEGRPPGCSVFVAEEF